VTRVVITGALGLIGGILLEGLGEDHDVVGIDSRRRRRSGIHHGDMRRLDSVERRFDEAEVVIDLAAASAVETPWSTVLRNNVPATVNALEAARRSGVKRVVYASSNHVTGLYEREHPYSAIVAGDYAGLDPAATPYITSSHPIRPDGPYGVGKAFGEAAARYYAEHFGLSVICLRIGTVNEDDRPRSAREFATLLTHGDLVQLVACCIDAPADVSFAIFYGVSANTWRFWEIADAEQGIGYRPRDDAERWRDVAAPALH
jgi:nucleoside-diphosphate-sugar epimerase